MPRILKLNWKREIQMVSASAEVEVLGVDKEVNRDPRWVIVNYDILRKHAERLHAVEWSGVILDEAHFIKNASQRTNHCLKLLGVQADAHAPVIGPEFVFLLTGTPMTRPKGSVQSAALRRTPISTLIPVVSTSVTAMHTAMTMAG